MSIEIIREDPTRLTRQVWRFGVMLTHGATGNINVVLDAYFDESRPSARHKYKPRASYGRIDRRECSIQNVQNVPRPDDVRYEAVDKAQQRIRVEIMDARGIRAPFRPEPEEVQARAPLRWQAVPFGRGDVEAFVDVPGLGRYLVSRTGKSSREFFVRLNNGPVKHRGSSEDCKRWVQQTVDHHRLQQQGFLDLHSIRPD